MWNRERRGRGRERQKETEREGDRESIRERKMTTPLSPMKREGKSGNRRPWYRK